VRRRHETRPATMRPVRRATRAALAVGLLAALLTRLAPAPPVAARGPVSGTGREIHASVEHQRTLQLPIEASHVALKWRGAHDAAVSVAVREKPESPGGEGACSVA